MRIALRELWRRPGRFLPVGAAFTLLVLLLLVLGAFLDGLYLGQTGAMRAQGRSVLVYSDDARLQINLSRLDGAVADAVAAVDGVEEVGGLGTATVPARVPASEGLDDDLVDVAVIGYERSTDVLPEPPGEGEAVVDRRLEDIAGVEIGDTLRIGPDEEEVTISAWVEDTTMGRPSIWVEPDTWRRIQTAASPVNAVSEDAFQILSVAVADDADLAEVAGRIDEVTGATTTVTVDEAIAAMPGVEQQSQVFSAIIAITFGVAGLVVALFFALLTLEREWLYAVLKAVGGRSLDLIAGVTAQAAVVAAGAIILGGAIGIGLLGAVPAELPVRLEPARLAQVAGGALLTAVIGGMTTLRRILRIDPAQTIG